jgi:hypothetical protein
LHIVEWQGYPDPLALWRLIGYRAWVAQQEPQTPVVATMVFLWPDTDVGDTVAQTIDGQMVQPWSVGRIALWEPNAQAALASGQLGLVVLSPLMRNVDAALVEAALNLGLTQAPLPQQDDLLAILGTFATPYINAEQFIAMVGRERLMSSEFVTLSIILPFWQKYA